MYLQIDHKCIHHNTPEKRIEWPKPNNSDIAGKIYVENLCLWSCPAFSPSVNMNKSEWWTALLFCYFLRLVSTQKRGEVCWGSDSNLRHKPQENTGAASWPASRVWFTKINTHRSANLKNKNRNTSTSRGGTTIPKKISNYKSCVSRLID